MIMFNVTDAKALAVKLCVRRASWNRPKFWPGTHISYPLYASRGQECLHVGSGRVCNVTKYTDGKSEKFPKHKFKKEICYCSLCRSSQTPNTVWWEIDIVTAAQIVYDESEVEHTSCTLSHKNDGTETELTIDLISYAFEGLDICKVTCVTCDADLGTELTTLVTRYDDDFKQENTSNNNMCTPHVFMVLFPDGREKHVTYGKVYNDSENTFEFCNNINQDCIGAIVHIFGSRNNCLIVSAVENEKVVSCCRSKDINFRLFDKKREFFLHEQWTSDNGDRIEITRLRYVFAHWGISEGQSDIIHFWTERPSISLENVKTFVTSLIENRRMLTRDRDFTIRKDDLFRVIGLNEDGCLVNNSLDTVCPPFERDLIVKRANDEIDYPDTNGYNIISNNCEHFVNRCRYGYQSYAIWSSQQVLKFFLFLSFIIALYVCLKMYFSGCGMRTIIKCFLYIILPACTIYQFILPFFAILYWLQTLFLSAFYTCCFIYILHF
uniref:LRAT domain-containing protein n=1 Tax=Biomphalaria glabrata TaxID=6526 RepID=A0A2C9M771_BIOGL